MKVDPNTVKAMSREMGIGYLEARKRLKGMQGPERHLVGQSRSAGRQGDVEEAEPGRRGVGKIVELAELLRHIASMKNEARDARRNATKDRRYREMDYESGYVSALLDLGIIAVNIAEKRSDLSNS